MLQSTIMRTDTRIIFIFPYIAQKILHMFIFILYEELFYYFAKTHAKDLLSQRNTHLNFNTSFWGTVL